VGFSVQFLESIVSGGEHPVLGQRPRLKLGEEGERGDEIKMGVMKKI
jgi:hypothetical protein